VLNGEEQLGFDPPPFGPRGIPPKAAVLDIPPKPLEPHYGAQRGQGLERARLEVFREFRYDGVWSRIDKDEGRNHLGVEIHKVLRVKASK
jgi:hypothetical protein